MTDVNVNRLLGFYEGKARYGSDEEEKGSAHFVAASLWLKKLSGMERTGRVSRSTAYWVWIACLALLGGSGFGGLKLHGAKNKMKVPAMQLNADVYLVKNSLSVRGGDRLLHVSTSRVYDPVEGTSSSSSSSGRSSYSSGYSGSSGRSHTGSGRNF